MAKRRDAPVPWDTPEGTRCLQAIVRRIVDGPPDERGPALRGLSRPALQALHECWGLWAHDGQQPGHDDWDVWLIRAGRGFGKTRAGAEWVQAYARAHVTARVALVGATKDEVRRVMIEGESGLMATSREGEAWRWQRDKGEFVFASGATAFVYSAEAPEGLRGPEHHAAWCDELAKWRYGDAAWDNLRMGLRLGTRPRIVVTTTPRPNNLMRKVMALPGLAETTGATRDNLHTAPGYAAGLQALYGGSRLGRQELDGELVDDLVNALWSRGMLDACRVDAAPELARVVVGVDPPAGAEGDACGIVAVGRGLDGCGYVLEDASVAGLSPEGWAREVAACAARHGADRVVAEKNQGGDMVGSVLRAVNPVMPLRLEHAVRGKGARAEPVATLYETGRMRHVGMFKALEDELCGMTPLSYEGPGRSPDRADALVWAAAALMLGPQAHAGVRSLA